MNFPDDLRYTKSHEWIRTDGTVGLTDFAQDHLGDVVHIEYSDLDSHLAAGDRAAEVESVKAVSDVFTPVAGTLAAVNAALDGNEELVNKDPYGEGWLFRIQVSNPSELSGLMDSKAYAVFVAEQDH
jgi:glycine cleavage system H protein